MEMGRFIDLTGQVFERLTVVEHVGFDKKHSALWSCQCSCGKSCIISSDNLRSGNTKSCGCIRNERIGTLNKSHGLSQHPLHRTWSHIKDRCNNPNDKKYDSYGGRGIKMCDEWNDFQRFYDWSMENGWEQGLTIDRINVNGNYEPDNCRWVTMKVQQNNRRDNKYITFNGKTQTMQQWCDELGIPHSTLWNRLNVLGWSLEKALNKEKRESVGDSL